MYYRLSKGSGEIEIRDLGNNVKLEPLNRVVTLKSKVQIEREVSS